jgi:hypothetical protein
MAFHGYRDPDTGRFITEQRWEEIQAEKLEEFEDWEDYEDFDYFDEDEVY